MLTLDDLKQQNENPKVTDISNQPFDQTTLEKIVNTRMKKNISSSMEYFWASLVLQITAYSLYTFVIVKYWADKTIVIGCIFGVLLFLPFTIVLMKKFKAVAVVRLHGSSGTSIHKFIIEHQQYLQGFYLFKKRYELILIPLNCAIAVFLVFRIYLPGGVIENPVIALITFLISLSSCAYALQAENKRSFKEPLKKLRIMLDDFRKEPSMDAV